MLTRLPRIADLVDPVCSFTQLLVETAAVDKSSWVRLSRAPLRRHEASVLAAPTVEQRETEARSQALAMRSRLMAARYAGVQLAIALLAQAAAAAVGNASCRCMALRIQQACAQLVKHLICEQKVGG